MSPHPQRKGLGDLPYELEREIFELTARAYPEFAPQLALVCKYVQTWVEAVIYETIVVGAPNRTQRLFLNTVAVRPPSFFGRTVRNLHIATGLSAHHAHRLLTICTSLSSLTCWSPLLISPNELYALLDRSLYLRRLSIDASLLWAPISSADAHHPSFAHPLFAKLTHLEIVNPPWWFGWSPLLALPRLTHLAFGDLTAEHADILEFFKQALESEVPRLEMLVAVSGNERFLRRLEEEKEKDGRFVCVQSYHSPLPPMEYWKGVTRGEVDFWSTRRSEWRLPMVI
ncbi:hypothetical protein C8F01DRAFT_1001456 [Mycena amicta]|nr:hypothetical protein C8F01DRAFT_1001456 [Mycena amicta]